MADHELTKQLLILNDCEHSAGTLEGCRLEQSKFERVLEIYKRDRAALGVVTALVMTVNFGAILTSGDGGGGLEGLEWLGGLSVILHAVSGLSALGCVWIGAHQYLKLNMLRPESIVEFVEKIPKWGEPAQWMTLSVLLLPLAVGARVVWMHGLPIGLTVAALGLVMLILAMAAIGRVYYQFKVVLREHAR